MNSNSISINQLGTEFEITIKIPLQPFIKLLQDKIETKKEEVKDNHILCVKEASSYLRISDRTLLRMKKSGKVKYISRGKRIFFKRSSLDELNVEKRLNGVKF